MTKFLFSLIVAASGIAHADGYGWKGSCRGPNLEVQVNPWDDDAQVIVKRGARTLYKDIAIVSTFEKSANQISFQDADEKKMTLVVTRSEAAPESSGSLTLSGKVHGLSCNLITVEEIQEVWGGEHLQVNVTGDSARLEFDCGSGSVESGWLVTNGSIDADGTITQGSPIQLPQGQQPQPQASKFAATVRGNQMHLTITTGANTNSYDLTKGSNGNLFRCM